MHDDSKYIELYSELKSQRRRNIDLERGTSQKYIIRLIRSVKNYTIFSSTFFSSK